MRLDAIHNVPVSFQEENEPAGGALPAEDVATVRAGKNVVVSPPRGFLNHSSNGHNEKTTPENK